MKIAVQDELSTIQKSRIIQMWNAEYPLSLAHPDISSFDEYLNDLDGKKHFLLIAESNEIAGWAMIFERENAKWFAIIIDGKTQGKGFGIKLIDALKTAENHFFGWVIDNDDYRKSNGEIYRSPLGFYKKLGFKVHENQKLIKQNICGVKIEWKA
jgi:ribosomal protein S18 acetylase RimI-like enzyme